VQIKYKLGLVVGNGGYYSKASGKKWVTPHKTNKQPLPLKNNPKRKSQPGKGHAKSMDYFERKLDDKHRLTIPTELRNEFASGVVLTRGFGQYLHLYPQNVWDREVEPALDGSILDEKVADLNVRFRRGKTSVGLDQKQGRVTIEQHLLDYAGIDRELIAVRAGAYWRILPATADV
jgi:MraZ protein